MQPNKTKTKLTYSDAGVNIDTGNALVERIKPHVKQTHRPGVLAGIGGFGGLFELPLECYQHPILVSGTDGVGTKLKLALSLERHETIGIDLVAMCANDILCSGAEPLFFLDYFATSQLDINQAECVIAGIAAGCQQAGMALLGGETAEMPGMYQAKDYDLAGFAVGIVEKQKMINGQNIRPGNALIAIASSGPHANGYSLIRKILSVNQIDLKQTFLDSTLGESLLSPTKIYVKPLLTLMANHPILGIAHITCVFK